MAEYVAALPEPGRLAVERLRAAIRAAIPREATETISYGIPAFKAKRVLVWYAAFSTHCSLFPTAAVIDAFRRELAPYVISKGTVQFPLGRPLPTALIKKLVRARVALAKSPAPRR